MKKILIALILVGAVAAAGWFFFVRSSELRPARDGGERALTDEPATSPSGEEGARVNPRPSGAEAVRSGPAGGEPAQEQPPKTPPSPIKIRFDAPASLEKDQPVPVTLVAESVPEGWPVEVGEGARLEFLLRLPVGVQLKSGDWTAVEMSEEERKDPTGPWSLYEKKISLQLKPGVPPETLAKETLQLAVVEEGTNWIITTRVRLIQGPDLWQAFGVLFATLQGNNGQFHAIPKTPTDVLSAQTS